MKSVISGMVGADAPYTATWISQFPEGSMREKAAETLMSRWGREDPKAAATWLANLPDGQSRQSAIVKFVDSAASLEPEVAWNYAATLTDPQKQKDALEKAAKQWRRVDDTAARAAIQSSGLPADTVAKLLKPGD